MLALVVINSATSASVVSDDKRVLMSRLMHLGL